MYKRLLLQGCRQLEIDCWDGRRNKPIVTHGNTLCTEEQFDNVVRAIAEFAFVISELPVVLSLEMHCSPAQQRILANSMMDLLGEPLLLYDELVEMGQATELSPFDLRRRVLVKGKVDMFKNPRTLTQRVIRLSRAGSNLSGRCLKAFQSTESVQSRDSVEEFDEQEDKGESNHEAREAVELKDETGENLTMVEEVTEAYRKIDKSKSSRQAKKTDEFYASCLCLRSLPVKAFMSGDASKWVLPITSINEDRLLTVMGVVRAECDQIEGLQTRRSTTSGDAEAFGVREERLSSLAIARLASNPPTKVGYLQRRTCGWLLRPYPLGLRFSGKNMSPLPGWLAGAQSVALNMSNVDLAVQLHFALFNVSRGYSLKPLEMRAVPARNATVSGGSSTAEHSFDHSGMHLHDDDYWPPPRERMHRCTIKTFSLHNFPKRGESRPRFDGTRSACHQYASQLSGAAAPPNNSDPSCPVITISLYSIGGFCGISTELPVPQQNVETEVTLPPTNNGMNAIFDEPSATVHCLAAEPYASFVRVGVTDRRHEVAFEVVVLGRLRCGYRVLLLRGLSGTRIELCYLFVHVSMGTEANLFISPRQLNIQSAKAQANLTDLIEREVQQRLVEERQTLRATQADSEAVAEVAKLRRELQHLRLTKFSEADEVRETLQAIPESLRPKTKAQGPRTS